MCYERGFQLGQDRAIRVVELKSIGHCLTGSVSLGEGGLTGGAKVGEPPNRPHFVMNPCFFFILYFLPDGNKKNKKKSHEYLEATTDVACRDLTLEPWGPPGLGTWKTGGSL